MKKLYILILISVLGTSVLKAQNEDTKRADKYFERLEFVNAAKEYLKLAESEKANAYVFTKLADSYYFIYDVENALKWYAKAVTNDPNVDSETIFRYAQMLKANSNYEESNKWMKKFANMKPTDSRSIAFNQNPDYLPKILEKGETFNLKPIDLNTEYSDFGGLKQGDRLYLVSARNESRKDYKWNNEPFLDIYSATINSDKSLNTPALEGNVINTKYHEGTVAFSPDGNTIYFSRESFYNDEFVKDSLYNDKRGVIQLFKATKFENQWQYVEALPFNSVNYSVDHPAVSPDGNTLFFSSDMPGGYGSSDLYKVAINEDGSFGEPVNLGQKVNTPAREVFPFVGADNTIYFSSNGHLGLGGLDVFFTKEMYNGMANVRNVGVPVNSGYDDFAFVLYEDDNGYVSSNRPGGVGSDDIYEIKKLKPLCDVMIVTTVIDAETQRVIPNASVSLFDTEDNLLTTVTTDDYGKAEFMVECSTKSRLLASAKEYSNKSVDVEVSRELEVEITIPLETIRVTDYEVELNPIHFDFDKYNITSKAAFELDKLVEVMNKYPEMKIHVVSHTDQRGPESYNQTLSENRAKATVQYLISKNISEDRLTSEGRGETEPINQCKGGCTEAEYEVNRRSQFVIVKE
jgi:outer membrane protein OmpA-like peptidoglycan-associated protein/tetratricopeptide (TPR) repeat protein